MSLGRPWAPCPSPPFPTATSTAAPPSRTKSSPASLTHLDCSRDNALASTLLCLLKTPSTSQSLTFPHSRSSSDVRFETWTPVRLVERTTVGERSTYCDSLRWCSWCKATCSPRSSTEGYVMGRGTSGTVTFMG